MPYGKEKLALNIQIISAIISVVLNIILVPKLSFIGASIAWCITEIMLVIMEAIVIKQECNDIKIKYITISFKKYFISSLVMAIPIIMLKQILKNYILIIFISLLIAPFIYSISCILLNDDLVLSIFNNLKLNLIRNKKVLNISE